MSEPTNITYYDISIPDLNEYPYTIDPVVLNNKTYYFEYKWNIREQKAYLAIYILTNNTKNYLLRSTGLVLFNNLAKYIFDADNWAGKLYFDSISMSEIYNYNQENISKEYKLRYIPE